MPLHPTTNGFRVRYDCQSGYVAEYDVRPENADDVRRQIDADYYQRGTLTKREFKALHDGVQVAVDVQACPAPSPWLARMRRWVSVVIERAVVVILGDCEERCCGK